MLAPRNLGPVMLAARETLASHRTIGSGKVETNAVADQQTMLVDPTTATNTAEPLEPADLGVLQPTGAPPPPITGRSPAPNVHTDRATPARRTSKVGTR